MSFSRSKSAFEGVLLYLPARSLIDSNLAIRFLLDAMFELPSLEGVEEVVISKQVVEGTAPPLYIYADRSDRTGDASA
jgi:ATP-dependent protease Clp ATPase subunit